MDDVTCELVLLSPLIIPHTSIKSCPCKLNETCEYTSTVHPSDVNVSNLGFVLTKTSDLLVQAVYWCVLLMLRLIISSLFSFIKWTICRQKLRSPDEI